MKKYNLTFWQKIELIPLRILWLSTPAEKRQTWHEVKKGMEHHTHKFTKGPYYEQGLKYWKCEHEGCNLVDPVD